jgi:hypothetical protein
VRPGQQLPQRRFNRIDRVRRTASIEPFASLGRSASILLTVSHRVNCGFHCKPCEGPPPGESLPADRLAVSRWFRYGVIAEKGNNAGIERRFDERFPAMCRSIPPTVVAFSDEVGQPRD